MFPFSVQSLNQEKFIQESVAESENQQKYPLILAFSVIQKSSFFFLLFIFLFVCFFHLEKESRLATAHMFKYM